MCRLPWLDQNAQKGRWQRRGRRRAVYYTWQVERRAIKATTAALSPIERAAGQRCPSFMLTLTTYGLMLYVLAPVKCILIVLLYFCLIVVAMRLFLQFTTSTAGLRESLLFWLAFLVPTASSHLIPASINKDKANKKNRTSRFLIDRFLLPTANWNHLRKQQEIEIVYSGERLQACADLPFASAALSDRSSW